MKGIFLFVLFLFLLIYSILFVTSREKKEEQAGLIKIIETVERMADDAKIRKIQAAESLYTIETGRGPHNLDELVQGGYLEPHDILDHRGNKLSYSPGSLGRGLSESGSSVVKRCGKCQNTVSADSRPGDKCPHCGVIWDSEKQGY